MQLLVHISNEEPILIEVEEMPDPNSQFVMGNNPQRRDGKDVHYLLPEVTTIMFPWNRITFIEVMPSEGAGDIASFARE